MRLIGLCGAAGSGKDTVAEHLRRGYGFRVLAFADPLYAAVSAITGLPVERLRDRGQKERPIDWLGKSPRELLQLLGTEFGRNMIRDDLWVRRAMQEVAGSTEAGCVITDVRFDNEAEAIREAGGFVIEIVRPGMACLTATAASHSSERGISREHIILTLTNSGTIDDLNASVDAAIRSLHADIM